MRVQNMARPAFSLVELLVVIVIIGILISLLLPAVQAARESARRMQCCNQLKQIGLALHNYVQSHEVFPPGCIVSTGAAPAWRPWQEAKSNGLLRQHGTSWLLQILPYLEQQNLYDQWDFSTNVLGNADIAQTDVSLFYCPTRRSGIRPEDRLHLPASAWTRGGNDYGGCIGSGNGWTNNSYRYFTTQEAGNASEHWLHSSRKGIFLPNASLHFANIRDGTGNTILIGELQRLVSPPSGVTSVERWAAGGVATLFTTNDKEKNGEYQTGGMNNLFFESPGSDHPGGAQFGMADGSIHFFGNSTNPLLFRYLGGIADGLAANVQ